MLLKILGGLNIEVLNSFKTELLLRDTEYPIKNKLKNIVFYVLEFNLSQWLKTYIELRKQKRIEA